MELKKNVKYLGPLYGKDIEFFFSEIDFLLYPTKNDAEPLVLYEAISKGVPVLSYNRGCINHMLSFNHNLLVNIDSNFREKANNIINFYLENDQKFKLLSKSVIINFRRQKIKSINTFNDFSL